MRLTRKRGLEIVEQGKKQFMAMWEFSNCPFKEGQDAERRLWIQGWREAEIKWNRQFERKRFVRKPYDRQHKHV